jgi:hypothetical protein
MTDWVKAWRWVKKANKQKGRKALKRANHRANRRAGKRLEDRQIRLNGWDVA